MGASVVMGLPQNGWFIRENPIKIKMDDLGVPLFWETLWWQFLGRLLDFVVVGGFCLGEGNCEASGESHTEA